MSNAIPTVQLYSCTGEPRCAASASHVYVYSNLSNPTDATGDLEAFVHTTRELCKRKNKERESILDNKGQVPEIPTAIWYSTSYGSASTVL